MVSQHPHISSDKRQAILQRMRQQRGEKLPTAAAPGQLADGVQRQTLIKSLIKKKADANQIQAPPVEVPPEPKEPRPSQSSLLAAPPNAPAGQAQGQAHKALPLELIEDLKRWISSSEVDLSGIDAGEIRQRQRDLEYRTRWLISLLKEGEREMQLLKEELSNRQAAD